MTEFLARMRRRGRSYRWIAKALGVPRAVCVERAEAAGLLLRSKPPIVTATDEPEPIGSPGDILGDGVCHWVAGEIDDRRWRMCGQPSVHGTAWCAHHFARVTRTRALVSGNPAAAT